MNNLEHDRFPGHGTIPGCVVADAIPSSMEGGIDVHDCRGEVFVQAEDHDGDA